MRREIIVACRRRDPKVFTTQKYVNDEPWNVVGGTAPNGVHATRYQRITSPDSTNLSPIAAWLVKNVPESVSVRRTHPNINRRVRCFNGRTIYEQILYEAETKQIVNCIHYGRVVDAVQAARRLYKGYGDLLDLPQYIDDWLFSIIEPKQSDSEYWNAEATNILKSGTTAIETNGKRWELQI